MTLGIKDFYAGQNIECSRVFAIDTSYPKHTHEEYIISANLKGLEKIYVDKQTYFVRAGQVTVYNPMAIQSSEFCKEGVDFISLHINPDSLWNVVKENNLLPYNTYPTLGQGAFKNDVLFKAIIELYKSQLSSTDDKEESVMSILATLLDTCYEDNRNSKGYVKLAVENMKDNLNSKLDLSALASSVGLSKYHFVRIFRKEVGIAPIQYHMQLRLIEARRMIKGGAKPIDVMVDLGFYDQSHFINTFRKVMAITPELYSRKINSKPNLAIQNTH